MPPEGYTTVTLPDELATELEAVGDDSPVRGVRLLLAEHRGDGDETAGISAEEYANLLERVENAESAAKAAEEQVSSLRREISSGGRAGLGSNVQ